MDRYLTRATAVRCASFLVGVGYMLGGGIGRAGIGPPIGGGGTHERHQAVNPDAWT